MYVPQNGLSGGDDNDDWDNADNDAYDDEDEFIKTEVEKEIQIEIYNLKCYRIKSNRDNKSKECYTHDKSEEWYAHRWIDYNSSEVIVHQTRKSKTFIFIYSMHISVPHMPSPLSLLHLH